MGKLYDKYKKLELSGNKKNNANLIFILAANETNFDFKYSIDEGDEYNQFWYYNNIEGPLGKGEGLLQVTQHPNGSVQLSIQGLSNIQSGLKNNIDYDKDDEYDMFMKYLQLF